VNPVAIVVEATDVPSGTQATVFIRPQFGTGPSSTATLTLTGAVGQPKRGSVNVTLPQSSVGIVSAMIASVVPGN
jgi:hypothetical protein